MVGKDGTLLESIRAWGAFRLIFILILYSFQNIIKKNYPTFLISFYNNMLVLIVFIQHNYSWIYNKTEYLGNNRLLFKTWPQGTTQISRESTTGLGSQSSSQCNSNTPLLMRWQQLGFQSWGHFVLAIVISLFQKVGMELLYQDSNNMLQELL